MSPAPGRVGLGGGALGNSDRPDDHAVARAAIDAAWEAGIRSFDTSPLYGGGVSETRMGEVLGGHARDSFTLASKTGVTRPYGQGAAPPGGTRRAADVWDYSPAATRRSVETSLARLRTDRLDLVHLHDVEGRLDSAMEAYPVLADLRASGVVGGVGIGSNFIEAPLALMARARFDAVLVAGRYTLLDQSLLQLVPVARRSGTKLIVGGVFNSGVLATGAVAGARYGYAEVGPDIAVRVRSLEELCEVHGITLRAAALQFPLCNPDIGMMLLGCANPTELSDCLAMLAVPIPGAFWRALRAGGFVDAQCPLP